MHKGISEQDKEKAKELKEVFNNLKKRFKKRHCFLEREIKILTKIEKESKASIDKFYELIEFVKSHKRTDLWEIRDHLMELWDSSGKLIETYEHLKEKITETILES